MGQRQGLEAGAESPRQRGLATASRQLFRTHLGGPPAVSVCSSVTSYHLPRWALVDNSIPASGDRFSIRAFVIRGCCNAPGEPLEPGFCLVSPVPTFQEVQPSLRLLGALPFVICVQRLLQISELNCQVEASTVSWLFSKLIEDTPAASCWADLESGRRQPYHIDRKREARGTGVQAAPGEDTSSDCQCGEVAWPSDEPEQPIQTKLSLEKPSQAHISQNLPNYAPSSPSHLI
eukprot:gene29693-5126_t